MNPNAKEFVPAHLMRKRQEEAMGSLAKQLGDVDLDESKKVGEGKGETSCDTQQNSTRTGGSTTNDKTQNQTSSGNEDTNNRGSVDPSKETTDPSSASSSSTPEQQRHKAQHNSYNQNNERSKINHETNGEPLQDYDVDDRYLLRAGENYCEFNGEQFIIPGDGDEYENELENENEHENPGSNNSHPVYDFGNAEDNEDESVINAYDEFLSELP